MDHSHPHPHPHPSLMSCVGEDHGLSSCSHCHGWGPKLSSSSSSSSSPSCHQLWDLVWVLLSVKEERASQDWITDMDRPTSVGFSQRYFWIFNVFFLTFHIFVLYSCTVRVDNRYGLAKERGEAKNTFVFCIIPAPNLGPLFIDEILPNPPTPPHFYGVRFITFMNSTRQMVSWTFWPKVGKVREDPHSGWNKIQTFSHNRYGLAKESKVAKSFKSHIFSVMHHCSHRYRASKTLNMWACQDGVLKF